MHFELTVHLEHNRSVRASAGGQSMGEIDGGLGALASWLEAQLGLPVVRAAVGAATEREIAFCALLREAGGASYGKSLAADPWATARELLARRDELRVRGWDGVAASGLPPLVNDLAAIEPRMDGLPPGWPERIERVRAALAAGQVLPPHRVRLAEVASEWPAAWRPLLGQLATEPLARVEPGAPAGTTLRAAQDALVREHSFRQADPTLRWLQARSLQTAIGALAAALAADPTVLAETVILCEDDRAAVQLDAALVRAGLPAMGARARTWSLPALQVLPLVLRLSYEPVDPIALLDFLSLPVSPIPGGVARALRAALTQHPGLGSRAWDDAVASLDADQKEVVTRWLDAPRVPRARPLPAADVRERAAAVASWARRRASALTTEADELLARSLAVLATQAEHMVLLAAADHLGDHITEPQLDRLLDMVREGGIEEHPFRAQVGGATRARSLGEIGAPARRLVWLGTGTTDPRPSRWKARELGALQAAGVEIDDGAKRLRVQRQAERHGLLRITEAVLAITVPGDRERRPHPIWIQVQEVLRGDESVRSASPLGLEEIVRGDDGRAALPWRFPTEARAIRSASRRRPEWTVEPALLGDRTSSSASSLATRLACPLRWVLNYCARIESRSGNPLPTGALLAGTFGHLTFESVFAGGAAPTEDEAAAAVESCFDERLALDAAPLAQPSAVTEAGELRRQLASTARRLARILHEGGYRVAGMETQVEGEIAGRTLKGSIDCLLARGDGEQAILDLKYGRKSGRIRELESGRSLQLATYAAAQSQITGQPDVPAGYLIITTATLHTPAGRPLRGAAAADQVPGAPGMKSVWDEFVRALQATEGWLAGDGPVQARPLLDESAWPAELDLVLERGSRYGQPQCRYCDYAVLCGLKELV